MDIDWENKIITIYKTDSFMTQIDSTFYEMDTDKFRLALKDREDDEDGIVYPDTHSHNPTYTVAGTTYAETILITNGYRVQFEDGQYTVKLVGSNNNLFDVGNNILVRNQVQVIPTNSAGLIVSIQGSGVTEQDKLDIADKVWDELLNDHLGNDSFGFYIDFLKKITGNKVTKDGDIITIYEDDGVTVWARYDLSNGERLPL